MPAEDMPQRPFKIVMREDGDKSQSSSTSHSSGVGQSDHSYYYYNSSSRYYNYNYQFSNSEDSISSPHHNSDMAASENSLEEGLLVTFADSPRGTSQGEKTTREMPPKPFTHWEALSKEAIDWSRKLPKKVMLHVFMKLGMIDLKCLIKSVPQVCRNWYRRANLGQLWKALHMLYFGEYNIIHIADEQHIWSETISLTQWKRYT